MTRLAAPLRQFLDRMDWTDDEVEEHEEKGSSHLSSGVRIAGQNCKLFIDAYDGIDSISVFCYLPFSAMPGSIEQLCVLANAINRRCRHARIEIDPEDGEIRSVVSGDFEGLEPTGGNIETMFHFAVSVLKDWMAPLAEVALLGRSATDALRARQEAGGASSRAAAGDDDDAQGGPPEASRPTH